jgi:serine protease Do
LTRQSQPFLRQSVFIGADPSRKWYTTQRCHEGFVATATTPHHPPLRVIWCAQGYREFDRLYDVALTAVTEDQGTEALVSRLSLQAVGYDEAVALSKRFLEAVQK